MPKINLNDIPESKEEFVPLPNGIYTAEVVDAQYNKEDNKEYIKATFKVVDGEHSGKTLRNWFHLAHPEAKKISKEQIRMLGASPNFNEKNAHQLKGLRCQIVTETTDDGKYANVKRVCQKEIPTGSYNATVQDVERRERKGKPLLEVTYRVSDGEYENSYLTDSLYLHERALKFTANRLKRMGADMGEFDTDNTSHINSLLGNKVRIVTEPNISSNGLVYNKITGLQSGHKSDPVDGDGVIKIDASNVAGMQTKSEEFDAGFDDLDEPF